MAGAFEEHDAFEVAVTGFGMDGGDFLQGDIEGAAVESGGGFAVELFDFLFEV